MEITPKFQKDDYIISKSSGDMAIVKGLNKKNYYQFKSYYDNMFKQFKDLKNNTYELQINYQKFWDLCDEEEKNKFNELLKSNK